MAASKATWAGRVLDAILKSGGTPLTVLAVGGVLWLLNVEQLVLALAGLLDPATPGIKFGDASVIYGIIGGAIGLVVGAALSFRKAPSEPAD